MKNLPVVLFLLLAVCPSLFSQEQNNIWYFGNHAGLDFNISPPRALESDLVTYEGTASVSDPAGHLLFYTDGITVWDRNHDTMPNGINLAGGLSSTQSALIVPQPGSCNRYFVFTTQDHNTDGGLSYSEVDMCLNNGLGDVLVKNILIGDQVSEKVTAIPHSNGKDFWIITHRRTESNEFLVYLFDHNGVSLTPVVSSVGSVYTQGGGFMGPIKASHDGTKIVVSSTLQGISELFDFNSATGQLTNVFDISQLFSEPHFVYGIEFSPNDDFLYLSTISGTNRLYQLNLETNELVTLNSHDGIPYYFGALQIGTDKKIYVAIADSAFLDIIQQPNESGVASQYEEKAIELLPGTFSSLGLPNFATYSFSNNPNTVSSLGNDTTVCTESSITLRADFLEDCQMSFLWSTGSTEQEIIVNLPGIYWVDVQSSCSSYRDTIQIDFITCQPECGSETSNIFGTLTGNEQGNSLAPTAENDGFYVAGFKDDSLRIIKMNLSDQVIWSRTFYMVSGNPGYVSTIILDSDGMLALCGNVGNFPFGNAIFVFRYNPDTDQVLWSKHYQFTPTNHNYCFIQKGEGNYLISSTTIHTPTDDSNLLEVDKNTGEHIVTYSYHLGSSDSYTELVYHNDFIYGVGRYTDGPQPRDMRNTLGKLDGSTGNQIWVKLGHIPSGQIARLYGWDLVIDQNAIISVYHGDPSGTTTTLNKLYLQKTDLDGNLIWLKKYDLPGVNDTGLEIIKSGDGFVIMANKRAAPSEIVLFKIDPDGNVLWSRVFGLPGVIDNMGELEWRTSQLIQVADNLIFTGYGQNQSGGTQMVVVRTDLQGEIHTPCIQNSEVTISVEDVMNPVFYSVNPEAMSVSPEVTDVDIVVAESPVTLSEACLEIDTIISFISDTICEGESIEGYIITGIYVDTFLTVNGCDSIRILNLTVNACNQECGDINGIVYGSENENERGYCIITTPENDGVYVAGIKGDSTLLLKIDLNGAVVWSRAFELFEENDEYPYSLIVDSEGMIVVSGTTDEISVGGVIYVLRYDPYNHQVLWQNEYETVPNSVHGALLQKGIGGNYVMTNDLNVFADNHIDVDLLEIDKNTGVVIPAISKKFRLSNRESLFEIVYDGNFIYGTGRYSDGEGIENFRNTVVKLNPDDGSQVWVKMGHIPSGLTARLYGSHLLVDQDVIISGSYGDPSGISILNTNFYLQKTDLDGNIIWLKQYLLSDTDPYYGFGLIKSDDGYIVLVGSTLPESDLVLFKIDSEGEVLWAKTFEYSSIIEESAVNTTIGIRGHTKLVEAGGKLFFVAYGVGASGNTDLLVVRTDLNGEVDMPCVRSEDFAFEVVEIQNPAFYTVLPTDSLVNPVVTANSPEVIEYLISPREECSMPDTIFSSLEATICEGEVFEGYIVTGIYIDTFLAVNGCDSIRTLHLTVNSCEPECGNSTSSIFGSSNGDERGYSLAPTALNDGVYVGGYKNGSITITKMRLNGTVEWYRTIDSGAGIQAHLTSIILDSEGMLVLAGNYGGFPNGNSTFVIKYNPDNNAVVWARTFTLTPETSHYSLIEKDPGGNYLISLATIYKDPQTDNANLLELDRSTGAVVSPIHVEYHLGASDGIADMVYHDDFIYGTGRYTDGSSPADMRHTIVKLDGNDASQVWVRLGHIAANPSARLYGADLVLDQDFIYTIYFGDPAGTSTANTKLYIQKTNLDGEVIWLKQYKLPGASLADSGVEIIRSGGGFVILAKKKFITSELFLFKIDDEGNMLWSRSYVAPDHIANFGEMENARTSQLIQVDGKLVFTAFGASQSGGSTMLVILTDLQGMITDGCVQSSPVTITVTDIANPVFYSTNPTMRSVSPQVNGLELEVENSMPLVACSVVDSLFQEIIISICAGGEFEGYTSTGVFIDTFEHVSGCDSIRVLDLTVIECLPIVHYDLETCEAFMQNGTNMDYSEFLPLFPNELSCADVTADFLFRSPPQENKHSCTPGVNNSIAMCVSSYNSCQYAPGHEASIVIEVRINPATDSTAMFTGLEFYEKAPANYVWIDGPTGPNNYPLRYGIRILKNGTEIFRNDNISTNLSWTLQNFDFVDNDLFRVDGNTLFRIELLPYCPVGNGAVVSAWDVDEIKIFGGCVPVSEIQPFIHGFVMTKENEALENVQVLLDDSDNFLSPDFDATDNTGYYILQNLNRKDNYFLKGYNNDDVLNGVSTLDLIYIQRHLLGITPFTTLHQYVAADINHNERVNVIDLVDLRKTLLGIYTEFPRNTSWRYGILPQDFSGSDLDAFTEIKSVYGFEGNNMEVNLVGIKVGDLNGDIDLNKATGSLTTRSAREFPIVIEEKKESNGEISLVFTSGTTERIRGLQFALQIQDAIITQIQGNRINLSPENTSWNENGIFRISWDQDNELMLSKGDILFTITTASVAIHINEVSHLLKPEAYASQDLEIIPLSFDYSKTNIVDTKSNYFYVEPNPVQDAANIKFNLVHGSVVHINFYDVSGRLVYTMTQDYTAGEFREKIKRTAIQTSAGLVYAQIVCDEFSAVQKLILSE